MTANRSIGLLLSGGLDSCILLGRLLSEGRHVTPIYVQSGLNWQREERAAVSRFLQTAGSPSLDELVVFDLPLADLYDGHWSMTGREVPDGQTPDEAVYLPGRNPLLLIKPAVWCARHGIDQLALGVLRSNPFSDATVEFFADFESMIHRATGSRVRIVRPFCDLDKRQVMQLGRDLPLELTFSCIAPADGLHCGRCNKCAERRDAFEQIGADDPTQYASNPQTVKTP